MQRAAELSVLDARRERCRRQGEESHAISSVKSSGHKKESGESAALGGSRNPVTPKSEEDGTAR